MQNYQGWKEFNSLPTINKLPLFIRNDRLFDVIYAQQFDKNFMSLLFVLADKIRTISKSHRGNSFLKSLLSDKRAMLFFVQPSTRTFMSFLNACQILGIQTTEIRDASTSSEIKGESAEDTIRTFSSYVDLIIARHHDAGFAEKAAWVLNSYAQRPIPVINGGSGKDQHPTQALLDLYTINSEFKNIGGIENKTYAMIGDLKRGRTVRSLSYLLALYKKVHINFISPSNFAMNQDILDFLDSQNVSYTIMDDFISGIKNADAIYATRIQDEHDESSESKKEDFSRFNLTEDHLSLLKDHCIIMHPLPRRNEISVAVDKDPRAVYWKQERNGMWIRAALILYLFNRENAVDEFII